MKLLIESSKLSDYSQEIKGVVEFNTPVMQEKISYIENSTENLIKRAEMAFEYVRDQIEHSFDTQSNQITISAEETLVKSEGICFAKAHLLAALLRGLGIPTGFCYQRVLRQGTVESGYALHGLNALYIEEYGWFRVDPRGNKEGIDSQFSIKEEKLAYPIREELGEVDYPNVFVEPLESVLTAMESSVDCPALFYNRPFKI